MKYYLALLVILAGGLLADWGKAAEETDTNRGTINPLWQRSVSSVNRDVPLRSFLTLAASNWNFSFFIDRRIDPETPIFCDFQSITLLEGIRRMTSNAGLDFYLLDSTLYIGPPGSTAELLYLLKNNRKQLQKGTQRLSTALNMKTAISWAFAESPASILQKIAVKAHFSWNNPEKLPVDCWDENTLHDIAPADCLTMILFGFGLCYEPSETNNTLQIIPVDRNLAELAAAEAVSLQERYQQATQSVKEKKSNTSEKKVVSGTVNNNSLTALFRFLEKELNVQFVLDETLTNRNITLETRVSCQFKKASAEKVASQLASQMNIRYRIEGNKIIFHD